MAFWLLSTILNFALVPASIFIPSAKPSHATLILIALLFYDRVSNIEWWEFEFEAHFFTRYIHNLKWNHLQVSGDYIKNTKHVGLLRRSIHYHTSIPVCRPPITECGGNWM